MPATNFEQFLSAIAEEAPHAVVLDWYRRLELTIRAYLATRGLDFEDGPGAERVIAADPFLGADCSASIAKLRKVRNAHTHGWEQLTPDDAKAFAREAHKLIGRIMRADDAHAT